MSNEELLICMWKMGEMGGKCEGSISKELLFDDMLEVPMCEKHLQQHQEVMALNQTGSYDIIDLVDMDPEERHEAFIKLDNGDNNE